MSATHRELVTTMNKRNQAHLVFLLKHHCVTDRNAQSSEVEIGQWLNTFVPNFLLTLTCRPNMTFFG